MQPSSVPLWVPLIATLLGAIAAGIVQTILKFSEFSREKKAAETALTAEVAAICKLIRINKMVESTREILRMSQESQDTFHEISVYAKSDYFTIFNALAPKIGIIQSAMIDDVVSFYSNVKIAFDALDPEGIEYDLDDRELANENSQLVIDCLSEALRLGDSIVQFRPK